eukprot:Hpha_TRINITY_DN19314_c0_g1::TRINITY_DN19314_c0_g1_i1::g.81150::m.81150
MAVEGAVFLTETRVESPAVRSVSPNLAPVVVSQPSAGRLPPLKEDTPKLTWDQQPRPQQTVLSWWEVDAGRLQLQQGDMVPWMHRPPAPPQFGGGGRRGYVTGEGKKAIPGGGKPVHQQVLPANNRAPDWAVRSALRRLGETPPPPPAHASASRPAVSSQSTEAAPQTCTPVVSGSAVSVVSSRSGRSARKRAPPLGMEQRSDGGASTVTRSSGFMRRVRNADCVLRAPSSDAPPPVESLRGSSRIGSTPSKRTGTTVCDSTTSFSGRWTSVSQRSVHDSEAVAEAEEKVREAAQTVERERQLRRKLNAELAFLRRQHAAMVRKVHDDG